MRGATSDSLDDSLGEDPDESGIYAEDVFDDEPGTVPCPYCRNELGEMAEVCPHCKNYISREDAPRARRPRWLVVTTIVLILASMLGSLASFVAHR